MDAKWKRRVTGVVMVLVAGMGCNPFLAPFILGKDDSKTPAEFALKLPDERKKAHQDARVVILVSAVPGRTDLGGIDKSISTEVVRSLEETLKSNKEKVTVIPAQQVEKWKSDNMNWATLTPVEIGQKFKADYVINLEIRQISIYEPRTKQQFMKGRAEIEVTAFDMVKATDEPAHRSEVNQEYPRGSYFEASDTSATKFQGDFVKKIANEIAWKFAEHPTKDRFAAD